MVATISDRISAALTGAPPMSAVVAELIADARAERVRLKAHGGKMETEALDPRKTSAEASHLRDQASAAVFNDRRMTAGIEHLETLFQTVSDAEKRRAREAVYLAVRRECEGVAKDCDKRLAPLCDELLKLVQRIAEADDKIFVANMGVPDGETPIPDLIRLTSIKPGDVVVVSDEFDFFCKGLAAMRDKFERRG